MSSSNKYTSLLEIGIATLGVFFGASEFESTINPKSVEVTPQPPVVATASAEPGEEIKIPIPSTDVVVNTNNGPYSSIVVICTYVGIGISIIGFNFNNWLKDYRTKTADTPQGKIEDLQNRIEELTASLEDRERRSKEALESISKDLESAVKANESLRKLIANQAAMISQQADPKPQA